LYKYREVNQRALCSLILNQLFFARAADFNDPFEASKRFDGARFQPETLRRQVDDAGIVCLCQSAENLAMWSYYGNGLRGFSIGYDLKRLLETLEPVQLGERECTPRWRYVHKVEYLAGSPSDVNEELLLNGTLQAKGIEWQKMFATKSTTFEHEDEYRVVIHPSPDRDPPYLWSGHGLYRHSPDAITEIVLGELMSEQDEAAIRGLMAGRSVQFLRARRDENSFAVVLEAA
jgi:hypothetical protein